MFSKLRSIVHQDQVLALIVGIVAGLSAITNGWRSGLVVFVVGLILLFAKRWVDRDTARIIDLLQVHVER